ncbi:MAG TPA: hypothetical protein VLF87_01315 [Patescibacteria group bacterium]|nr:hypothetical protein [Patescibacteria group bacterium]
MSNGPRILVAERLKPHLNGEVSVDHARLREALDVAELDECIIDDLTICFSGHPYHAWLNAFSPFRRIRKTFVSVRSGQHPSGLFKHPFDAAHERIEHRQGIDRFKPSITLYPRIFASGEIGENPGSEQRSLSERSDSLLALGAFALREALESGRDVLSDEQTQDAIFRSTKYENDFRGIVQLELR